MSETIRRDASLAWDHVSIYEAAYASKAKHKKVTYLVSSEADSVEHEIELSSVDCR